MKGVTKKLARAASENPPALDLSQTIFTLDHVKALVLTQWELQKAQQDSDTQQKRILENHGRGEERKERQGAKPTKVNQEQIRLLVMQAEAILEGVLHKASEFHLIRSNELAVRCFWAARRSYKHECKVLPPNTPMTECCITRRRHHCERLTFFYREPPNANKLHSAQYTVHPVVTPFLVSISWIASFPTWIAQLVRQHLTEWKTTNDIMLLTDEEFWNSHEFTTLTQCIDYVHAFLAVHVNPMTE
jgi:hypothetical protein